MALLVIGVVLSAQLSSLLGQDMSGFVVDVSEMADGSISQAKLEAARQAASGGLPFRSFRQGEYRRFSGQYTPPELPEEKKGQFLYGLAMFSDDGCSVTVTGNPVLARLAQRQHLPNLGESFHVLPVALAPGKPVEITVDYFNTIYVNLKGSPPDIDGLTLFLYLIPVAIAVDANRDGNIAFEGESKDTTSEETPFRFWINDDHDGTPNDERDVVPATEKDYADGTIQTMRDLEDFARLYLRIGGLHDWIADGTFKIGLKFSDASGGSATINAYKCTDPDGSTSYLTDEAAALAQVSGEDAQALGQVTSGDPLMLPADFWTGSGEQNPTKCLLFEGSGEGKGQLVLTVHKDGTQIGEGGSAWLDLKQIKKMYQRFDSAIAHPWAADQFEPAPDEPKNDVIVFVHGWRMSPDTAGNFAETMFKRLWQRGFKGRFAAFHWDTWWHDSAGWIPYLGDGIDSYLANYNDSERIAWQSASALKNIVNNLPFENKHLVAHSMGNIVAGEALRQAVQIKNCALLQGAVPAACYDEGEHLEQTTQYNHHAGPLFFTMWDNQTPDDDNDSATRSLAYRGRLKSVPGNLINFFLPEDYATSFAWEVNNDQTKPPNGPLAKNYEYQRDYPSGQKLFRFASYDPYQQIYNSMMPLSDPYESMSFACRTWGKAVGAFGDSAGSIASSVNLGSSTYQLPGEDSGFGDEHSGQFNFSIQPLRPFYNQLLQSLDVDFFQ